MKTYYSTSEISNLMRNRVLIIPAWYPSDIAPITGVFIEEQAIVLSEKYEVMVYAPWLFNRGDFFLGHFPTLKEKFEHRAGLRVYRKRVLPPQLLFSTFWCYYLYAVRQGFKRILAIWGRPDLIHAHVVLPTGWVAMKLGVEYSIPVVLTEHSGYFSKTHLTSPLKRHLVRETLIGVERVLAVSPALAGYIREFHPAKKIDVVGNVIRTHLFIPSEINNLLHPKIGRISLLSSQQSRIRFLSIAFLIKKKGIHYLLEAVKILIQREITNFELIIGGDGAFRHHLEKMATPFSERCRFLGMLNREEVIHWMQQCDVFVLPSLGETFGVVLGEAMSCGKPVIATRCGGPEFVVTSETGLLVNTADPVALADAMTKFILNEVTFDALRIRQSVQQRFGEEAFLHNVSAIYEKIWSINRVHK
jgi:glycosyltransferase involved in cell wall biosynthesis